MPFFNPKLIISTYFDSLIRQIDIYTEELLAECMEDDDGTNDVFELKPAEIAKTTEQYRLGLFKSKSEISNVVEFESIEAIVRALSDWTVRYQTHDECFNYEDNLICEPIRPELSSINSYLNHVRYEMIAELERAQEEAFIRYEIVKSQFNKNKNSILDDNEKKGDQLFELVFENKFYFLLNMDVSFNQRFRAPFKLYLVRLDFYLNKSELDLLG